MDGATYLPHDILVYDEFLRKKVRDNFLARHDGRWDLDLVQARLVVAAG